MPRAVRLIWLLMGLPLAFFTWETLSGREDWPVAFSAEADFVPVQVLPVSAEVRRDHTRFGADNQRSDFAQRRAVWVTVEYTHPARPDQPHRARLKYAGRLSTQAADVQARWVLDRANWPLQAFAHRHDPDLLTTSTYSADRGGDLLPRLGMNAALLVAYLAAPLVLTRRKPDPHPVCV